MFLIFFSPTVRSFNKVYYRISFPLRPWNNTPKQAGWSRYQSSLWFMVSLLCVRTWKATKPCFPTFPLMHQKMTLSENNREGLSFVLFVASEPRDEAVDKWFMVQYVFFFGSRFRRKLMKSKELRSKQIWIIFASLQVGPCWKLDLVRLIGKANSIKIPILTVY